MEKNIAQFGQEMRRNKAFRQKILSAWKNGGLQESLLSEGFTFSLEDLNASLPQVRSDIRAGEDISASCFFIPSSRRRKIRTIEFGKSSSCSCGCVP